MVGKDEPKIFHVHKGLLAHYSECFARAFGNDNWLEVEGTASLDADEPEVFQLFQNFIYTGRLTDGLRLTSYSYIVKDDTRPIRLRSIEKNSNQMEPSHTQEDCVPLSFELLAKLACFADMRVVPTLTDMTNTLLLRKVFTEAYIPLSLLDRVAKHLPRGCILRGMLSVVIVFLGDKRDFDAYKDRLPQTFVTDLACRQLRLFDIAFERSGEWRKFWTTCLSHDRCCRQGHVVHV